MQLLPHESQRISMSTANLLNSVLLRCLQVGEVGPDWFNVYLIPETLRVTILGEKREGDVANIEIEAQTQVEMASCQAHSSLCACLILCIHALWLTMPC